MKSIAFGTLKGGTGKTTSCFNLAGALALNPKNKILLVDGDPQCNLTNDIGMLIILTEIKIFFHSILILFLIQIPTWV